MALEKPYSDIPGTVIFDADQARKGYHLNQFCMSQEAYATMMLQGGRSPEGSRRIGEPPAAEGPAKEEK